ncbi:hypothetical protein [Mycobacterium canetti]|nr:hypothetical protein [Mycobacterium canetti]
MAAIVEWADRAAAIVSDLLHTSQPATYHGRGIPIHAEHVVRKSVAIVEPHIELLATAPPEPMMVWGKPQRCNIHQHLIGHAETMLTQAKPSDIDRSEELVRESYAAAGACDDCNGWDGYGQKRELTELSGIDVALRLVELHNQTRAELGKTRLRHTYSMPCPRCGGRVGRDDGQTIVTCDNSDCRASWTEREYQFLAGLITSERLDMEILRWLLAEAYARLDDIHARLDRLTDADHAALQLPGAGAIVVDAMRQAIQGHQTSQQRSTATSVRLTEQRQIAEDSWAWRGEQPYRPPKRQHRRAIRPADPPVEELVDPSDAAIACGECNMVHRGECV